MSNNKMGRPNIAANKILQNPLTKTPEVNWRIRRLRITAEPRMTQRDLADILMVSVEMVKAIEQGKLAPSIAVMRKVKKKFKITWEYLLD